MFYEYKIHKFKFFDNVIGDILTTVNNGAIPGCYILCFCAIDYMGLALNPKKQTNTSEDFKKFISEYLGKVNPDYLTKQEELWAIRNSVIHVYGRSAATDKMKLNFLLGDCNSQNHLKYFEADTNIQAFWLNIQDFVAEIIAAIELFFRNNRNNEETLWEWERKLFINFVDHRFSLISEIFANEFIPHSKTHPYLKTLESVPEKDIHVIKEDIKLLLRQKYGC